MDYLAAPALQNLAGTQIYAAARIQTDFSFDAGGNRAKQLKKRIAADSSRELEETLYLGSYEREIHSTQANGSATPQVKKVVHRHTLGGFGVYTQTTSSTGTETKLTTILKDHLGSTDLLYTGIWNGSSFANPQTEKQAFDPWGERKNAETWQNERTVSTDAYRTSAQGYDRGYTGHEQLDDSGLIHMNGRIYDPELGRMLSPDPVVQVPEYSQNFNRYSYVMNNPMNMTESSGFSWWNPFSVHKAIHNWAKENWRTIVVIVVVAVLTYFTAGAASAWGAGLYASATGTVGAAAGSAAATAAGAFGGAVAGGYIGAVAGGLGAALNGGNLGDVLRGALIGGVQGAITGGLLHGMEQAPGVFNAQTAMHVAGHGVVGGAANVAMGGKFGDGFLSAAVSAGASDAGAFGAIRGSGPAAVAGRTICAGVVGGTASALGGGKFANGAYTAAFQHLLNYEAYRYQSKVSAKKELGQITKDIQPLVDQMRIDMANGVATDLTSERYKMLLAYSKIQIIADGDSNVNTYDLHTRVLGAADNDILFPEFSGHKFNYAGTTFSGSDVNYIHVGMTMRANGFSYSRIVGYTAGWNAMEAVRGDDGGGGQTWGNFTHQTRQIVPGAAFAVGGATYWDLGF